MSDNLTIKKKSEYKNKYKIAAMTVMVSFCSFLAFYFHYVLHIETLYTHFFYIPIVLSVMWWKRKGLVVPIFLSVMLISAYSAEFETTHDFTNDILRVLVFMAIGMVVVYLRERMDKNAEQKLVFMDKANASEKKYRDLFEYSQDALMILEPLQWKFTSVNSAAIKLFGMKTKEEFVARSPWKCSPKYQPDGQLSKDKAIKMLDITMKSGSNFFEWTHKKINGDEFLATVLLMRYEFKEKTFIYATVRDISSRKKIERKAEKLQGQLLQSQKMEALGSFVGGIAHDFNNLLTPILGISEFSLSSLPEKKQLIDNFNEIKNSAVRGKELISRLLVFSRKQSFKPEIINLNTELLNIEKLLNSLIGENIETKFFLDENLGNIKADPIQIEQIILNLAANARDAMPNGGKLIIETANMDIEADYIESHADFMFGDYIVMCISDSGIGMDKKTLQHAFDPFFSTKEKGKGTGLGLSIIYGIVKRSGGNILVYSEMGRGTTFKIFFKKSGGKCVESKSEGSVIDNKFLKGNETILVVEDDESVRSVAKRMLQKSGYNVIVVADAIEAKKIFKEREDIHLIFTDIMLPKGVNGLELVKAIKVSRPKTKVLYMSGYTDNVVAQNGILDKGVPFIQKPFGYKTLGKKVREALDGK